MVILRQTNYSIERYVKKLMQMGIKCVNSYNAHKLCANKYEQYHTLKKAGIPIPKTEFIEIPFSDIEIEYKGKLVGGWPLVAKPLYSQRGELVELCNDIDDAYVHSLKIKRKYTDRINPTCSMMIQQYMNCPIIVAWTIGDEIKSTQIRLSKNGGFFISNNRDFTIRENYPINEKLKNIINSTTKILGVEIAKIDIFENGGDYMICEVNSPGGFAGRDNYFNSNHAADIAQYVVNL
jgi:glutathione synthase/RimK-type ligase-like ATP-grasp enzyme